MYAENQDQDPAKPHLAVFKRPFDKYVIKYLENISPGSFDNVHLYKTKCSTFQMFFFSRLNMARHKTELFPPGSQPSLGIFSHILVILYFVFLYFCFFVQLILVFYVTCFKGLSLKEKKEQVSGLLTCSVLESSY